MSQYVNLKDRNRNRDLRHFYEHAKRVEGDRGNAPGHPHMFGYLNGRDGELNARKETIHFEPEPAMEIKQKEIVTDITGTYGGGMVADLPFDMTNWTKMNNLWTSLGFGCLLVGVIFMMKSK